MFNGFPKWFFLHENFLSKYHLHYLRSKSSRLKAFCEYIRMHVKHSTPHFMSIVRMRLVCTCELATLTFKTKLKFTMIIDAYINLLHLIHTTISNCSSLHFKWQRNLAQITQSGQSDCIWVVSFGLILTMDLKTGVQGLLAQ